MRSFLDMMISWVSADWMEMKSRMAISFGVLFMP